MNLKKIKFKFCNNFFTLYENYKNKLHSNDDVSLNFLEMNSTGNYNETRIVIFLIFDSIIFEQNTYKHLYKFVSLFTLRGEYELKALYDYSIDNGKIFSYEQFKLSEINKYIVEDFFINSESNNLYDMSSKEVLNEFNIKFFNNLYLNIDSIVKKLEFNRIKKINPEAIFSKFNYKSKLNIFILFNEKTQKYPFLESVDTAIMSKTKFNYSKNTDNFMKFSFKFKNCYISVLNFFESFFYISPNFNDLKENFVINLKNIESINNLILNNIIKDSVKFWYENYVMNKYFAIKNNENNEDTVLKDVFSIFWIDVTSFKSLAWKLFNKYLDYNKIIISTYYSLLEYDLYTTSLYSGIQYLEEKNDRDLELIIKNFKLDKIDNWNDLESYSENTKFLYEYDINSAFTHSAKNSYLCLKGSFIPGPYDLSILNKKGFIFVILDFKDVRELCYIPFRDILSKQVYYNIHGKIFGWYTIDEINSIKDVKNLKIEILNFYEFSENNTKKYLEDFVYKFLEFSKHTRIESKTKKIMLNSIWGMFSYTDKKYNHNESNNNNIIYDKVYKNLDNTSNIIYEKDTLSKSKFFIFSSIINSNNRINLKNYINYTKKKFGNIYSINIDGFWTDIELNDHISDDMGKLKIKNFRKKIIFFNLSTYLNITDNYLVKNFRKITDFNEIKEFFNSKDEINNNDFDKSTKEYIDFCKNFSDLDNIKKNLFKSIVNRKKRLFSDDTYLMLNLSSLYTILLKVFNEKIWDEVKSSVKINTVELTLSLFLYSHKIIEKQFHQKYTFVNENYDNFEKIYNKFDAIIYNWIENYKESYHEIHLVIKVKSEKNGTMEETLVIK